MCLIVVAHRVSERYPLVIAANRDEDYERPTHPARWWDEAPETLGGRDALHGGSWLGLTRSGRFSAVTNVRGAIRTPENRSRGELVSGFLLGQEPPRPYIESAARRKSDYAAFHLLAGVIDGELAVLSDDPLVLDPGVHGFSNAPAGIRWPKVDAAIDATRGALQAKDPSQAAAQLLRVLHQAETHRDPTRDIFVTGERYGTRSSTVIVSTPDEVLFIEQSFKRGGASNGGPQQFTFRRG